jgi:hypothetical protein
MTYKGDILQVLHAVEWRRSGKEVEEWIRRQRPKGVVVNTFCSNRQRCGGLMYSTSIENLEKYKKSAASDVVD